MSRLFSRLCIIMLFFFLMIRRPPRSTRTDTLFPYTTLFRSFAALLDDAGLTAQDRAPMTPIVKLVFGAAYDKTRLAEYACVLGHAKEEGLRRGALAAYLDRYPGWLKGLVKDAPTRRKHADRQERRRVGKDGVRRCRLRWAPD